MNEITRIHLAKVAYDVDITAKKQLEKYIKELEEYTNDSSVLTDIEIRMTELLAERHVKAGGVIAKDDVEAIRKQLGEPYEFAEEDGDIAVGPAEEVHHHPRRFFRDTHGAVLGGVLSGIALYAKVDALWVRLGFILILFGSFGFAFFGYLLLWVIVPPAKSATDRLRQAGQTVTLSSIRALKEDSEAMTSSRIAPAIQRAISAAFGAVSLLSALAIVTLMLVSLVSILNGGQDIVTGFRLPREMDSVSWLFGGIVVFGLLLLVALFCLIAYSSFAQKLTKRMIVSGIVIIILGLASSIAAAGVISVRSWQTHDSAQRLMKSREALLPATFKEATSVVFDFQTEASDTGWSSETASPVVHYMTGDNGSPRYKLVALPGAKLHVTTVGTEVTITLRLPHDTRNTFVQSELTVYGPALKDLTANGLDVNYSVGSQNNPLTVTTDSNASVSVDGTIGYVKAVGNGSINLNSASITSLAVVAKSGLRVTAGTIHTLDVTLPAVCPAGGGSLTSVTISGVTSGTLMYNGNKRNAVSYETNCAELNINDDQSDY